MSRELFQQIAVEPGQPPSITREIFRSYREGALSKRDYEIQNAIWVAENLQEYPARPYPPMPQVVRSYALSRRQRIQSRNEEYGLLLGEWTSAIQNTRSRNDADQSLVEWSIEKCGLAGLVDHVAKLETHLGKFLKLNWATADVELGLSVQVADAIERQRG